MSGTKKKTATKKTAAKKTAKSAEGSAPTPKKPVRRLQKTVVREIRRQVEDRLAKDVKKASLSDYIRLVQLEKELTQTVAKETKATWVDPKEDDGGEESGSGK